MKAVMERPFLDCCGLIAGNGVYPFEWVRNARTNGVQRIVAVAFEKETDPALASQVDEIIWLRVGQLGALLKAFSEREIKQAIMAGQIAPGNLFDLRPDWKALMVLAKLQRRNAETLFGAIASELASAGVNLLDATTFMEPALASEGLIAGPKPKSRQLNDFAFGQRIAREMTALDIGQSVVVKNGTVLAVEAFEGTNEAIQRGGRLGRGNAILAKVSKPNQDFRFDVPVIGLKTLETAKEAGVGFLVLEADRTLLLERSKVLEAADRWRITIYGREPERDSDGS